MRVGDVLASLNLRICWNLRFIPLINLFRPFFFPVRSLLQGLFRLVSLAQFWDKSANHRRIDVGFRCNLLPGVTPFYFPLKSYTKRLCTRPHEKNNPS